MKLVKKKNNLKRWIDGIQMDRIKVIAYFKYFK